VTTPFAPLSCLTCRRRVIHIRGLCPACYTRHRAAVRAGKTTWAALEAAGLALPAQPVGKAWRKRKTDNGRERTP
jgi:hypothetical protein